MRGTNQVDHILIVGLRNRNIIVIALEYEKNKDNNDTSEYDGILEKLTQEIEAALKWFTVPAGMERTEYVSYINNIKEQKWF